MSELSNSELLKKDWQILTARSNIDTMGILMTVLQNQILIMAKLEGKPVITVHDEIHKRLEENQAFIESQVKDNFPEYPKQV